MNMLRSRPILIVSLTLAFSQKLQQPATAGEPMGAVHGVVRFRGNIPKSALTDDAGNHRDLLRVDRDGGLGDVVAYLTPTPRSSPSEPHTEQATMDQRDYEFFPRVLAVRAGQGVKFTNSDPANHNVRTSSSQRTNQFNVFTGIEGSYVHRFCAEPGEQPVRLGCDIHPWMQAWIYVFDHPCFAVTDDSGNFRIASIPAGRYKLNIRQPAIRYAHEREIVVSNTTPISVQLEIRADDSAPSKK